ncbi:arsenic resistance protein [Halomonas marinisediminis]|uniref:Arsenic resistance protein n=1 Tax=Halomonas marinisediminis TaxID=2546095 RepID=A0ABY2D907_9GAMM|nr:arsenic resistance protein [Halomonas marinisediminis]TDB04434.1 arsenic resistance protein [Halomonas marinisediminis]
MRDHLERHQVWLYLAAIITGLGLGLMRPEISATLEGGLWPLLGVLLYATFTQVPLGRLALALQDWRFATALVAGNFLLLPLMVGTLVALLPLAPAVRLGVLLVLLVPCTDWFITFTHLGKGDAGRAIAATPLLLVLQLVTLPFYLWLFLDLQWLGVAIAAPLLGAFVGLILVPLVAAGLTQRLVRRRAMGRRLVEGLGWLPVPLLAMVLLVVAATQIAGMRGLSGVVVQVLPLFIGYLALTALLGWGLGRSAGLTPPAARTLTFSFATRNSFVMLPIALALPEGWQATVVVVVCQSLVELFGMLVFLRWVPGRLIPDR